MTEAEQLKVLECRIDFTPATAEWLDSLNRGDRVMVWVVFDGELKESGLSIVSDRFEDCAYVTLNGRSHLLNRGRCFGYDSDYGHYFCTIGPAR